MPIPSGPLSREFGKHAGNPSKHGTSVLGALRNRFQDPRKIVLLPIFHGMYPILDSIYASSVDISFIYAASRLIMTEIYLVNIYKILLVDIYTILLLDIYKSYWLTIIKSSVNPCCLLVAVPRPALPATGWQHAPQSHNPPSDQQITELFRGQWPLTQILTFGLILCFRTAVSHQPVTSQASKQKKFASENLSEQQKKEECC